MSRVEKSTLQTMVLHVVLQAESKLALFLVYEKTNYVTLWIYALVFFISVSLGIAFSLRFYLNITFFKPTLLLLNRIM